MQEESKALRTMRRLGVAWPLLMLPFIPEIGKVLGELVFMASIHFGVSH